MRPRFNRELKLDASGTLVVAEGPIEIDGTEHEAYLAVWISQELKDERTGEVVHAATGLGIDEKEEQFFPEAIKAADVRLNAAEVTLQGVAAEEAGPRWDCVVETRGTAFRPGKAKAEGWASLELPDGHEYRVMWTDDVELVRHGGADDLRRQLDEERTGAVAARAASAAA